MTADAQRSPGSPRVAHRSADRLVPDSSVRQAGELVGLREVAEARDEVGPLDRDRGFDGEKRDGLRRLLVDVDALRPADAQDADRHVPAHDRLEQHRDGSGALDGVLRQRGLAGGVGDEIPRPGRECSRRSRWLAMQWKSWPTRVRACSTRHDEVTRPVRLVDHGDRCLGDLESRAADVRTSVHLTRQRARHVGDRGDRSLVVARRTCLRALGARERLHGVADDRGDRSPQHRPSPLARRIARRVADEERKHEHRRSDCDPDRDLPPPEVQGDPDHGQQGEGCVAGHGAVVGLTQQGDDDEVGERRNDVRPARQARPRNEDPGGSDRDREHRGYPDVRPVLRLRWDARREHRDQPDGSEREESPDDLRLQSASVGAH